MYSGTKFCSTKFSQYYDCIVPSQTYNSRTEQIFISYTIKSNNDDGIRFNIHVSFRRTRSIQRNEMAAKTDWGHVMINGHCLHSKVSPKLLQRITFQLRYPWPTVTYIIDHYGQLCIWRAAIELFWQARATELGGSEQKKTYEARKKDHKSYTDSLADVRV